MAADWDALKNAQCEFALQIGAGDLLSDLDQLKQSVSSIKAGSVQIGFQPMDKAHIESMDIFVRRQGGKFNAVSAVVPDEVRRLLVPSWFKMPEVRRRAHFSVGRSHRRQFGEGDEELW